MVGAAATQADMVGEIVTQLYGFTNSYDTMAGLGASLSETDLSIKVDSAEGIARGAVEIDDELIYIEQVDRAGRQMAVARFGRGFRGSKKATHESGSMITINPTWPRYVVAEEINRVISGLYPQLYGIKHQDFATHGYSVTLPLDAERILGIRVQDKGEWYPVREWDLMRETDGVTISLLHPMVVNRKVRVLYSEAPDPLVNPTDLFSATTGLPESCRDVVTMSVQARLLPFMDVARLPVMSAEADELKESRPVGAALQISQELSRRAQTRLLQEASKLADRYPVQIRRTRA